MTFRPPAPGVPSSYSRTRLGKPEGRACRWRQIIVRGWSSQDWHGRTRADGPSSLAGSGSGTPPPATVTAHRIFPAGKRQRKWPLPAAGAEAVAAPADEPTIGIDRTVQKFSVVELLRDLQARHQFELFGLSVHDLAVAQTLSHEAEWSFRQWT